MSDQITLEEALKLVSFHHGNLGWQACAVFGNVYGNVNGDVCGDVRGDVEGNVLGNVYGNVYCDVYGHVRGNVKGNVDGDVDGDVCGNVNGTINRRKWQFVETPMDKLQRLLYGASEEELLKLINHMENN